MDLVGCGHAAPPTVPSIRGACAVASRRERRHGPRSGTSDGADGTGPVTGFTLDADGRAFDDDGFAVPVSETSWKAAWIPVLLGLFVLAFGATFLVLLVTQDRGRVDSAGPTLTVEFRPQLAPPSTAATPSTSSTTSSTVASSPPRTRMRLAPSRIETGCGLGGSSTAIVVVEASSTGGVVTTIAWDGPDAGATTVSGAGSFEVPIGPFRSVQDQIDGDAVTVTATTADDGDRIARDQLVLTVTQDPSCAEASPG